MVMEERNKDTRMELFLFLIYFFILAPLLFLAILRVEIMDETEAVLVHVAITRILLSSFFMVLAMVILPFLFPRIMLNFYLLAKGNPPKRWAPKYDKFLRPIFLSKYFVITLSFMTVVTSIGSVNLIWFFQRLEYPVFISTHASIWFFFLLLTFALLSVTFGEGSAGIDNAKVAMVEELLATYSPSTALRVFEDENPRGFVRITNPNRINISTGALKMSPLQLERLVLHELSHTKQKGMMVRRILVLTFFYSTVAELAKTWIEDARGDGLLAISTYYLLFALPYLYYRFETWNIEIGAEKNAARIMGSRYSKICDPVLQDLQKSITRGDPFPGTGLDRFALFYPPSFIQTYHAARHIGLAS